MGSETVATKSQDNQEIDLPPGFRFHPTDEELITHYLSKKLGDDSFAALAIGEADLNKCEPWDLPGKAKMGENEWYFFYLRDKKYPTGLRTNRATEAGYWKATGKDKEIFRGNFLIGMKKTLVFYKGRAPKGAKSNWVMHEYRLEGKSSLHNFPKSAKTEWVISRVFEKNCNGKKIHVKGAPSVSSCEGFVTQSQLPPLMGFSQLDVSCFSNQFNFPRAQTDMINSYKIENDQIMEISGNRQIGFSMLGEFSSNQMLVPRNYQYMGSMAGQDCLVTRGYSDNSLWPSMKFECGREMMSVSQETGLTTDANANMFGNEISSAAPNMVMGLCSGCCVGAADHLEGLWPC